MSKTKLSGILSGGILEWGDFVLGGYCPGGYCPGGYCPGGYCPDTPCSCHQTLICGWFIPLWHMYNPSLQGLQSIYY